MALRVISVVGGTFLVLLAVSSAIRTVILPRAAPSLVTRGVFRSLGVVFRSLASGDYARRDRVMSLYAPLGLCARSPRGSCSPSRGSGSSSGASRARWASPRRSSSPGSSLFTLGFLRPETFWLMMVSYIEAAIGLFLLALLITYLPSMYGAFSRREVAVTALSVRAGEPPSGREMIWRYWRLERMDHLREVWRRMGALVRRRGGDAHIVAGAGVLPIAAARPFLGHRRRRRARRRRPDVVERARYRERWRRSSASGRATCACAGWPTTSASRYDPDPTPDDADLDHASGVGRGGGRSSRAKGCRSSPTASRHGATSPGGASTTTRCCWPWRTSRSRRKRRGARIGLRTGVPTAADGWDQAREAPAYVRPGLNTMSRTISTSTT